MVSRSPLRPVLRVLVIALLLVVLGVGFSAHEAAAGHTHEAVGAAFYNADCPTAALGAIAAAALTVESPPATAPLTVAVAPPAVASGVCHSAVVRRSESRAPPVSLS